MSNEQSTPEQEPIEAVAEASDDGVETLVNDALEDDEAESGSQTAAPVDADTLRRIVEGALLAAGQALTVARIIELFDAKFAPTKEDILAALERIAEDNAERGFELKEVASGFRLQVRQELAPWINRLWEEKPQRYSRALLETLALIAYRQPITRGDIEEIRGVAVSSHIMKTLMEREWVKVVGQRDVPGRPSLYATTRQFLDYFNVKSLDELPSLGEIRDLDDLNPELDLYEDTADTPDVDATEEDAVTDVAVTDKEEDTTEAALDEALEPAEVADVGADDETPADSTEESIPEVLDDTAEDDSDIDEENRHA